MTIAPARFAISSRSEYTPGTMEEFGTVRPSTSDTIAMVFAVNCPAQAPIVGLQTRSISSRPLSSSAPVITAPTAS
jgi:hypothetical protein